MSRHTTEPAGPARWAGLAMITLAGVIWGSIGPVVIVAHDRSGLSPLTLSSYRAALAIVVLVLLAAVTGRLARTWSVARQHWRRVVAVGVLTSVFQMLFFVAVVAAGVSVATVVCLGFAPVVLMLWSLVWERRNPTLSRVAIVVMALSGLLLVSLVGGGVEHPPALMFGVVLALIAGTAYALSAEIAGPLTNRLDIFTVTIATMVVAGLVVVPVGFVVGRARDEPLATTDPTAWLAVAYMAIITTIVAYALMFTGLRTTPSGAAVIATLIEPVTAVVLAVAFLGERLTIAGVVGALLIFAAIAALARENPPDPTPQ